MKLKKLTAMLALMTGLVFSQGIVQAETTLFDIDFSKDYGTAQNGTYSSAELKATHSAITDTWAGNTSFATGQNTNGESYAILKPSSDNYGNAGLKISTGSIKTGILTFDFKFDARYASHGGGSLMRMIGVSCSDNSVQFGIPTGEYIHLNPYNEKNPSFRDSTGTFDIRIRLQRADQTSDWTVSLINKKDASMPVVLETTLPAASYPTIENFIFYMNWVKSGVSTNWYFYTLKGTHKDIEKAKLEASENFDVTGEITVLYPEAITASENMTYELKEKDGADSILIQSSWRESNKLVITPLKYLDYDKDYVLSVSGTTGGAGTKYDGSFPFKTEKEDISVKNQILTYLDAENAEVSQENAVGAEAKITVSNSGGERELMAVITAYDAEGKLLNTNATPFSKSSDAEIKLTAKLTGEQSLSGVTVKTLVLEKLSSGIITAVK